MSSEFPKGWRTWFALALFGWVVSAGFWGAMDFSSAQAADHFLTIGGGPAPTSNQASIEKNVLWYRQVLADLGLAARPHDVFFGDGDSPARDVQYFDANQSPPRVNELLAQLRGEEKGLVYHYRGHHVEGARGGSSPENLDLWFREVGSKLVAGDRLLIYMTGHGGKGPNEQDPHFYMWNRRQWSVKELVSRLDRLPQGVRTTLVMVQCYSGGFANSIFNDADATKGLGAADRCGFFATVHNRPAAGCTPDIRDEDYQEYSSAFWAALTGVTRSGQVLTEVDRDGDGKVSFAEAHAHALLSSETIDVPVKTSDAFLRAYSRGSGAGPDGTPLVSVDRTYETLLSLARPLDRAVLEGLSQRLELQGSDRGRQANSRRESLEHEKRHALKEKQRLEREIDGPRKQILETLKWAWPELESPWRPDVPELLARDGLAIVATIEGHTAYSEFSRLRAEIEEANNRVAELDRRWAKHQRFIRTLENVALEANLPSVATAETQARYRSLRESEEGTLGSGPSVAQTASRP